ncbi:MAG: hypothetical protein ABIJ91_03720 [Candidatus Kuenenbacteria bacterium]
MPLLTPKFDKKFIDQRKIDKPDPFAKFFDAKKIGTGKYFTAGSREGKRKGLWGALRSYKGSGKRTYGANLSMKDLDKFHGLISKEMERRPTNIKKGLSLLEKRRIMDKADRMAKQGEISFEDKKDLRGMLNALSGPGKEAPRSKQPRKMVIEREDLPTVLKRHGDEPVKFGKDPSIFQDKSLSRSKLQIIGNLGLKAKEDERRRNIDEEPGKQLKIEKKENLPLSSVLPKQDVLEEPPDLPID